MNSNTLYKSLVDYVDIYYLSEHIILDDIQAYIRYPNYNHIYDKLWLSKSQGMPSGPIGIYPRSYPIIFKPIVNLYGMSRGFKRIDSIDDYELYAKDGFFWQPFFKGDHITIDIVLNDRNVLFYSALKSIADIDGSFKVHYTLKNWTIPKWLSDWIDTHMVGYSGCMNIEIIGNVIIEAHLRLNGDFQLYALDFCKQLSALYESNFISAKPIRYQVPMIYLFPLFIKRSSILVFKKQKTSIKRILSKSETVRTYFFDTIDSLNQGTLIRVAMFDTYDYSSGSKLQSFIKKLCN